VDEVTRAFAIAAVAFAVMLMLRSAPAYALACAVRNGACNAGENLLFSMSHQDNAHAGTFDYYAYSVCCDEANSSVQASCGSGSAEALSFFRQNNTHVSEPGYYSNKLCVSYGAANPLECSLKASCNATEACVVSLHDTGNSHAASCSYYDNQLCCSKIPDLFVNNTSITPNVTLPVFGSPVLMNNTVWNIGDSAAYAANVSCYANGTYFGSSVISSVPADATMQTPRYSNCNWTTSCSNNISIVADPSNMILELNESNNAAWRVVPITDRLYVSVSSPTNGQSYYRGSTVTLESSTTAACNLPSYTLTWYNQSTAIATGDSASWDIPLADALLGAKTINATATAAGYVNGTANANITILNNQPATGAPTYNATPSEILRGNGIEIDCAVSDTEDAAGALTVNVSIRDPSGAWSNVTTTDRIGSTYYRNYGTTQSSMLGTYAAACAVADTDGGRAEASSTFLVYQSGTVTVNLNATSVGYGAAINVSGSAHYSDTGAVTLSDVSVSILGVQQCSDTTDAAGGYACVFNAPQQVGTFAINVQVTDKDTGKLITNSTALTVSVSYGEPATAERAAQNVGCYEVPSLVQNPDGSITKSTVRICVWK
jgi:hypothetical protein